jgi:glycosyltransferase involved in cell wall biosynthesis
LAISACHKLKRKLVVIGTGQDAARLRSQAGTEVAFLGWLSDEAIRDHLRRCRALLFPGEEDFGIVPVEAQACGTPVIAFGRGGAAETVVAPVGRAEPTGLLFREQSADCLAESILWFERHTGEFDPLAARRQALQFNPRRFDADFDRLLRSIRSEPISPTRHAA